MNYLNLIIDPLNQELVQSSWNATIGVNLITTKNNTIVTLTTKNVVAKDLLPTVSSMDVIPRSKK
jgi:hypothetical protein